ncbi:MAG TPA: type II toxin-antitoxin system HicA family toxin [Elusimicrobiota bacterium]|nr:type II toxin-antitoxin system HicA family toxin [Elusimicrobiota bacterium]
MKPPLVSGARVVKAFKRAGYRVTGQRGSHVKLFRDADESTLIIPLHHEVDRWTLKGILADAGISVEQFMRLL